MTKDWTYAKQISFDHASWCNVEEKEEGEEGRWGIGQVLSWLLV